MNLITFQEAARSEITLFDAHIHCSAVTQFCVSSIYLNQPRSHSGLIFVVKGAHVFFDPEGRQYCIKAGEMLYAPQGCNYYHQPCIGQTDENGRLITDTLVYVADFQLVCGNSPVVFSGEITPVDTRSLSLICEKFHRMVTGYNSAMPSYFRFQSQLYDILSDICDEYSRRRLTPRKYELLKPAIEYLASKDAASIDVSMLASLCYISENYFRKLFSEYYDALPQQYLNDLKMKRAAHLLETGDHSISDISMMLGYSTPSYFSSCFKRYYGCLPSKYKTVFF